MNILSVDTVSDNIYALITIFGKRIKYRKSGYSYVFKNKFYDLMFYFARKTIKRPYKIIPMGTYCFSRLVTTFNKFKPSKIQGEKSCPFDFVKINDFEVILNLLEGNFNGFYDDIHHHIDKYKGETYLSAKLCADFCHDGELSQSDFVKRYDARIQNLYNYFNDKNFHKYLLIATPLVISENQLVRLISVLNKYMDKTEFDVILLNQSGTENTCEMENLYVINHNKFFVEYKIIKDGMNWAGDFKTRRRPEAQKIYNDFTFELIKILKSK
ncbi:hypothetical protein IJ818_07895 [bacterium]|nr:hypothetical protein [bacterium]